MISIVLAPDAWNDVHKQLLQAIDDGKLSELRLTRRDGSPTLQAAYPNGDWLDVLFVLDQERDCKQPEIVGYRGKPIFK